MRTRTHFIALWPSISRPLRRRRAVRGTARVLGLCELAVSALLVLSLPGAAQAVTPDCPAFGAQPLPAQPITGGPVAPSLTRLTHPGLCMVTQVARSTELTTDRDAFIEATSRIIDPHDAPAICGYIHRRGSDFSNHMAGADVYSDFPGGACFAINDDDTAFVVRARGLLNVTPDMVSRRVHFGLACDDGCSLTLHDRSGHAYPVVIRPPALGAPAWRSTNTAVFSAPGLYPIELLYVQIGERANLELSMRVEDAGTGLVCDTEQSADQATSSSLMDAGYQILHAQVGMSTEDQGFADEYECRQCQRAQADSPGNGGCGEGSGRYCNAAAVCAPCTTALRCGPSCVACPSGWACDPAAAACVPAPAPAPEPTTGGSGCSVGGSRAQLPWGAPDPIVLLGAAVLVLGTRRRLRGG